jgi:hypothetical protein
MQLDADIELKVAGLKKSNNSTSKVDKTANKLANLDLKDDESDSQTGDERKSEPNESSDEYYKTLFDKFQNFLSLEEKFCEKNTPQKVLIPNKILE